MFESLKFYYTGILGATRVARGILRIDRVTQIVMQNVPTIVFCLADWNTGPCCSKLTTSLVNEMLKFQISVSQLCQFFLLRNCEKLLSFFQPKMSVYLVIKL